MESCPSWGRRWLVAARLFALPASLVPVGFGATAAVTLGGAAFRPGLFLAALLGMALVHTGANMLSDAADFRRGLDREPKPGSGAIVRGWLRPGAVRNAAFGLMGAGCAIGLGLVPFAGPHLVWIGAAGAGIGAMYSRIKPLALGDAGVFLAFGVLGALGSWTVQAGAAARAPAVWAVPIGLHIAGILHANNWRDLSVDRAAGMRTLAVRLGERGSRAAYAVLLFAPFPLVTLFAIPGVARFLRLPALPAAAAAVWLAFPLALSLFRGAGRGPRAALDAATARLNLVFGLLYLLGLIAGQRLAAA